jgi:DNA-directed RNA polymerase specialized sigma subunit
MGVPLSFEPEAREDVVNEVVSHENETISMQQMVSILRDWQLLTTREQRILIYRLDNPCETQRRTAEYFGISQQQYARHKSKITTVFPFVKAKM